MTSFKEIEDHDQKINKTHPMLAKANVLNLQFVTRW